MKIMQLIANRNSDFSNHKIPTIAFLGDSVTHGVFELIPDGTEQFIVVYDTEKAYPNLVRGLLAKQYPAANVNIVNAGISGDSAVKGLARLERDVLSKSPDLTVVCFGLNDCHWGRDHISRYLNALEEIFKKLLSAGSEVIFLTPNMMATEVSARLPQGVLRRIAERAMGFEVDGTLEFYLGEAKKLAGRYQIPVCDVYAKWKTMQANGVNVTEQLSNFINHPTREMHWLFANSLVETMMQNNK